jgi:hypothetical protein
MRAAPHHPQQLQGPARRLRAAVAVVRRRWQQPQRGRVQRQRGRARGREAARGVQRWRGRWEIVVQKGPANIQATLHYFGCFSKTKGAWRVLAA